MNIIKKKFAYLFAMGVFVLGISSSIPVFAASSSNSIIHKREYMTEYYGTAEPPVRCGESHLSGLTEPLHFVY